MRDTVTSHPTWDVIRNKHGEIYNLTIGSLEWYAMGAEERHCDSATVTFTSNGHILIDYDDDSREASQRFVVPAAALAALREWVERECRIRGVSE